MRASELELPKGVKVYLDMDGVLANFFEEYAKLAGVKSYRDVPPAKVDPTLDKMVGTDFFARLPKFPVTDKIVDISVQAAGSYGIISSPLRNDFANSEKHKREWIKKHLNPQPTEIFITPNKEKHAVNPDGTPNVLIDDRGSNITAWENAGGIGVKFQADEDSLKKILDGLNRARRIGSGKEKLEPQDLKSRDLGKMIASKDDEVEEGSKDELFAVQKAIDDIYKDPNWRDRKDELKKLINRESELEKEMQLVKPGKMWRYDHDSLGRKKEVEENFADGKKKGKSRPGRVKRSGASCNGSVTDLRKRAKNASGEKAKMYHWCANMKGGKGK
jgi:hypothetical protein